jgi:hypothetical protein
MEIQVGVRKKVTVIIDDEDFEKVSKYNWVTSTGRGKIDVRALMDDGAYTRMHYVVLGLSNKAYVVHKNGNPLDNRKENLLVKGVFSCKHEDENKLLLETYQGRPFTVICPKKNGVIAVQRCMDFQNELRCGETCNAHGKATPEIVQKIRELMNNGHKFSSGDEVVFNFLKNSSIEIDE